MKNLLRPCAFYLTLRCTSLDLRTWRLLFEGRSMRGRLCDRWVQLSGRWKRDVGKILRNGFCVLLCNENHLLMKYLCPNGLVVKVLDTHNYLEITHPHSSITGKMGGQLGIFKIITIIVIILTNPNSCYNFNQP